MSASGPYITTRLCGENSRPSLFEEQGKERPLAAEKTTLNEMNILVLGTVLGLSPTVSIPTTANAQKGLSEAPIRNKQLPATLCKYCFLAVQAYPWTPTCRTG